ncbi:MAG: hypothetical protein OXF55_14240 [Caldilineaceae bacterium]|nr:hypothetical protein [Caldilineaceae bacterium]
MTISLVFNELSLRRPAPDIYTAQGWMTDLVRALKVAADHEVTVLRMPQSFGSLLLSRNYPMNKWFDDHGVSPDERAFVLTYATQYELIRPPDEDLRGDNAHMARKLLFEARCEGEIAEGLGLAFLLNGLAISVLSERRWDTPWLALDCDEVDQETGEFEVSREQLRHVSSHWHISSDHVTWIADQFRARVRTGFELLHLASKRFPNLEFCDDAKKQIQALTESSMHLPRVRERLLELGRLSNEWESGNFDYRKIHNSSDESPSTMGKFGSQRIFVCPDGRSRTFRWHLKGLPLKWRIHICADPARRKLIVGYVGRHLDTATG